MPSVAVAPGGRPLVVVALATLAVLLANLIAQRLGPTVDRLDIGSFRDRVAVAGFHAPEHDAAGMSYRWSRGDAELTLRGPADADPSTVTLSVGGLPAGAEEPRDLALAADGRPWLSLATTDQLRHYELLLPPGAMDDGEVDLGLRSATTVPPADERPLGVRVDAAALAWPDGGWHLPPIAALLVQLGIGLAWLAAARGLGVGRPVAGAVALALIAGMAAYAAYDPQMASSWYGRLLGGGLASGAVLWGAGRLLPRAAPGEVEGFTRALLLITLAAVGIRLAGALYPVFFSHDLGINSRWLRSVQLGELAIVDKPSEFGRRVTPISPAGYILALPAALLWDRDVMLQALYALLDGLAPLLMGLLARRLGLGARAALLAAGLMAFLPMQLTALYWGFARQIVGQWLTLLLMVALAGEAPRGRLGWSAATALIVVILLIHPSTLLLGGAALGLYLLAGMWPRLREVAAGGVPPALALAGPEMAPWRGWALALLAAAALAVGLQYAEHARVMLQAASAAPAADGYTGQAADTAGRLAQVWVGLEASFAPLPLILVGAGLGALLWRATGRARLLAGAWLASALLFLAVDCVTGQQVRYGYFSAPLVCGGVAALLEPLLRRPLGRWLAWALALAVALAGLWLWGAAVFGGVKPSVNALTH